MLVLAKVKSGAIMTPAAPCGDVLDVACFFAAKRPIMTTPTATPDIRQQFGDRYAIERELGRGGMGAVYPEEVMNGLRPRSWRRNRRDHQRVQR